MTTEDYNLIKTLLTESGGPSFKKLNINEPPNVRDRLKDGENLVDLYNELYAYCNLMTTGMDTNESCDFTNEAEENFWEAAKEVLVEDGEDEMAAVKHVRSLGFQVQKIDRNIAKWYWVMKNGNHSPVSEELSNVLKLASDYPKSYEGAILKHDNLYWI